MRLLGILLITATTMAAAESDWTQQCNRCKCVWSSGKKFADCHDLQMSQIPADLSGELREIDFSHNPLHELAAAAFHAVGLQNVHKLKLDNCSLSAVDAHAFQHLQLLIEVYLPHNQLQQLDAAIFADNGKLRIISLSGNRLRHLAANTFANLTHLQRLNLDGNRLESIDANVFGSGICTLSHLNLQNNRLTHLAADFTSAMPKLNSLDIHGNPWLCDCELEAFRRLTLDNMWVTMPVECEQPQRVHGRRWSDEDVVFACAPHILEPPPPTHGQHGLQSVMMEAEAASNFTLACRVDGSPRPAVAWYMSTTRISGGGGNGRKYERVSSPHWDNLTIISMSYRDRGEYRCVASNAAGSDERSFSLYLRGGGDFGSGGGGGDSVNATSMSDAMLLIIALAVTTTILLVLVLLLICFCWRRRRRVSLAAKSRPISEASEFISMEHRPGRQLEKSLLTDVNPVIKPPRQYSSSVSSSVGGGTELGEAKRMLIDDESIYNGDDELKMYDSITPRGGGGGGSVIGIIGAKSAQHHHLDVEPHYPPDLLSFPTRHHATSTQISPAGSSASTVADTTRLPVHHVSNGMTSPVHTGSFFDAPPPSLYRTLPYSRSHSPFAAPHHQLSVRVARPGAYVTIPRRPRMSWSSDLPAGAHLLSPEVSEPVYDNLGLRATAKGTSALSLNKVASGQSLIQSPSPSVAPIIEQSLPAAATLPRHLNRDRALSPAQPLESASSQRGSWAMSMIDSDSRRDSTASLIPSVDARSPKIPPRPPPKPKKRVSTGPLFEDEGEDGTEV